MMSLVNICQKLFTYPHHLWIEIPNPVHLDSFVLKISLAAHLVITDDHRTFYAFSLMLRHYSEHQTQHFVGR